MEGRTFPVSLHYLREPSSDYVRSAVETVLSLHSEEPPGDILVFLTGQAEIERCVSLLREAAASTAQRRGQNAQPTLHVLPLFAGLPPAQQQAAFRPAPGRGVRKCVVSSSVALATTRRRSARRRSTFLSSPSSTSVARLRSCASSIMSME